MQQVSWERDSAELSTIRQDPKSCSVLVPAEAAYRTVFEHGLKFLLLRTRISIEVTEGNGVFGLGFLEIMQ